MAYYDLCLIPDAIAFKLIMESHVKRTFLWRLFANVDYFYFASGDLVKYGWVVSLVRLVGFVSLIRLAYNSPVTFKQKH